MKWNQSDFFWDERPREIGTYPNINPFNDRAEGRVISWWSGGVASAIACKLALERWGDQVELVFCDTAIEHPDTFRFMDDYKRVMGVEITVIKSADYSQPEDVWRRFNGLNFANGAPCSTYLKKYPRIKYQELSTDFCQIFGFDFCKREMIRATNMLVNNPDLNPVFPLLVEKYDRPKILSTLASLGIRPPISYKHFLNNNCIGADDSPIGGCVQGGIGYWQKMERLFPKKYEYMAAMEHELSAAKGKPVTVCKDQRNGKVGNRLFLRKSSQFPDVEDISDIKGRQPVTPFECNGFCSTDILNLPA